MGRFDCTCISLPCKYIGDMVPHCPGRGTSVVIFWRPT